MLYDKKVKHKNILCLESHWGGSQFEPRTSIKPILDYMTISRGTSYQYHFGHTKEEFRYVLENARTKDFNLLLLAFHGKPEKIFLGVDSEFTITFEELLEMMGDNFAGYGVHFSSCSVLNSSDERIREFIKQSGISFVTGYGQGVDYIEGEVMDFAYLGRWFKYKSNKSLFNSIEKSYGDLIKENNFKYYLR